jgi:Niemann-Pick C1 protein
VLLNSTGIDTPTSGHLVGATFLGGFHDDNVSLGRGASLLDPDNLQQRQYRLNTILRRFFYRLGYFCASSPLVTLTLACIFIAFSHAGWKFFSIEKDPVRLWVSPSSESRAHMKFFDEHFGPIYRVEQIFVSLVPRGSNNGSSLQHPPILSYDALEWWFSKEKEIRELRTTDGIGLDDVCFKPAGPDSTCVVQSISGWFDMGDLSTHNTTTWRQRVLNCAMHPLLCLPDFGQPLEPKYILGGLPQTSEGENRGFLDAKTLVISFVIENSVDPLAIVKAETWETALRHYLEELSQTAIIDARYQVTFSTGVSLKEELDKSTNTNVTTVAISYLIMFLYVSITLGRPDVEDRPSLTSYIFGWLNHSPNVLPSSSSAISTRGSRSVLRRIFVHSKVVLGMFGLVLVMLSITSSVGLLSYVGIKVTLIIAQVIPFLVLAVGVDSIFLLVAELERQNSFHGPNAYQVPPSSTSQGLGLSTPMSPSLRQRDSNSNSVVVTNDDSQSTSAYLSPEERVARTLAKMGPSLLLSASTQAVAFALGAFVPMPAVHNFALYAALSVLLNAILQVTVFISALTLDLRRIEVRLVPQCNIFHASESYTMASSRI